MRSSLIHLTGLFALSLACGGLHSRDIVPRDDKIDFLPVPDFAKTLPLNKDNYAVEAFGKGVYMITDGSYNSIFAISTKGVIVVDLPPTIGHHIFSAIENITSIPITHVVYSHSHADHIGGVSIFGPKVTTIAHVATAQQLALLNDPNRPVPKVTFSSNYDLNVGNQTLQLHYRGENHIPGNLFIYSPVAKVLMLVDVIYPRWTPFSELGQAKSVPGYILAHDQVLEYDFKHFVGGHLGLSGSHDDVLTAREYINDLKRNCEDAIKLSATSDPKFGANAILKDVSNANPGNQWAAFRVYLDVTANECANKTNEKWLHRLAAADVFQYDNAHTMIESLRIDWGILGPFGTV